MTKMIGMQTMFDLLFLCQKFIKEQEIICPESTCEDRVYENAPEFVNDICKLIGYHKYEEEND